MDAEALTTLEQEITPEDLALTPLGVRHILRLVLERVAALEEEVGLLRAENAQLRAENAHLQTDNQQLRQENERLRELTQRSSRNSSQPPSSDGPAVKPRPVRPPSGKKRGGQPGHEGHSRKLYPPDECRSITDHHPPTCRACGTALSGEDADPVRHQVVEIPPVRPVVDEHRLHRLPCPNCGTTTCATLPPAVPEVGYGPRLAAMIGAMSGPYRLSERLTQEMLGDFFQTEVSLGSVNQLRQEVAVAVAAPVAEATTFAQQQPIANADETSWRQGNGDGENPGRRKYWLWVLVTGAVTVVQIWKTRGTEAAKGLLGQFAGYLGTDRWASYNWFPLERRQLCWSHLLREFEKITERDADSQRIGAGLQAQGRALFGLWHRVRDGTLSREEFAAEVEPIRAALKEWLLEGASYVAVRGDKSVRAKTSRTCADLLKMEAAFWLFVRVEGVEPTNNAAEQAVRPAVIWRRTSLGTQSAAGSLFVARMLTVTQTLRSQDRNVLEYLTAACAAARQGRPAPSLLPLGAVVEKQIHLSAAA